MSSASVRRVLAVAVAVTSVAPVLLPAEAPLAATLALALAAVAGIATLWVVERRRPLLDRRFVLVVVLVVLAVAVLAPPRRSRDLWAYAFYGRMVNTHHVSPYAVAPSAFPHDPGYQRVDQAWRDDPSVYSPGFTWFSVAVDRVAGDHPLPTRLAYEGLAALAVAGAAALVLRRTGQPIAALLVAVNPVALVWTVNCGHADAVMGLALLAAVLAAERRRPLLVGLLVATAALIKLVALLALLPLAWWLWRHRRARPANDDRPPLLSVAGLREPVVAVAATVVVVGAALAVGGGADLLAALKDASVRTSAASIWRGALDLAVAHPTHDDRVLVSRVALLAIATVAGLASWSRSDRDSPGPAVAAAVLAFVAGAPYTLIWYSTWVIPVLLLSFRSRLTSAVAVVLAVEVVLVANPRGGAPGVLRGAFTALTWTFRAAEVALLVAIAATSVGQLLHQRRAQASA